jgi:hypothetical protein
MRLAWVDCVPVSFATSSVPPGSKASPIGWVTWSAASANATKSPVWTSRVATRLSFDDVLLPRSAR